MEIASLIISIFSLLTTGITVIWTMIDRSNRYLKYKICKEIYKFYAPCYLQDNLPTTEQIYNTFAKGKEYKRSRIQFLLIELSHENKIEMVTDLSSSFKESRWKPNVNIAKGNK